MEYSEKSARALSPMTLAFVGDAVYGLLVRERLAEVNRPAGELHRLSVTYVKAASQAEAFKKILTQLTENEISVFKRGRNAHTSVPKSASVADYHTATGVEALFGYLHLSGNHTRIRQLFKVICEE